MRRGHLITVSLRGDLGKPRPAVVIQSDAIPRVGSVLICPLTSDLTDTPTYRLTIAPDALNSLDAPSQVMIDKIYPAELGRCREREGKLSDAQMREIDRRLAGVVGIA